MIRYYYFVFVSCIFFSPIRAGAQEKTSAPARNAVSVAVAEGGRTESLVTVDVFEGRKVPLVLSVQAPTDSKVEIQANTFLLARKLASPLQGGIAVGSAIGLGTGAPAKIEWDFQTPADLEQGRLLLQFSSREGEQEGWRPSGKALVRVHSISAMKKRTGAILKAMATARLELVTYGATDALQAELQTLGFTPKNVEAFPMTLGSDAIHLWIADRVEKGEITQAVRHLQAPVRVIVVASSEGDEREVTFVKAPDWLVSVYRTRKPLIPNPLQLEWILSQLEVMLSGNSAGLFESGILE